ncbi:MAG: hypothetical protein EOP86_15135 [Verrucomicrobiaceae bacterium]|nr:MAG: hypothetical protein EOP86_15135 [Verrucomicrobiaceae bacterium]
MSAEYLIHFSDGSTDGPYTEEDLLDMVDADELSAGAICEDTATGKRMRVRQLFQVIPPAPASGKNVAAGLQSPPPAKWIPAPLPEEPVTPVPAPPRARTLYKGHPSLLNYPLSLLLSAALAAAGWYAGRWDGMYLAAGWIAGCAVLAAMLLIRSSSEYSVSNRRVEARNGLLSKSSKEIRMADIRSINVSKTGLKGLLGVGTVIFSSSGGTEEDVVFHQILRAHAVKELVRFLQDRPE